MPRPVHFELLAANPKRAEKFYSKVFGWKFKKWDGPMNYWMIDTTSKREKGINGGMRKREKKDVGTANFVEVKSVGAFLKKVKQHGGKVVMPPQEIPKVGFIAYGRDTEGNAFGVIGGK